MPVKTFTGRQFNQNTQGAKRAARAGPVFITDRGRPAYVLLSIDEYVRITGGNRKIADALAAPGAEDIEFDPPRVSIQVKPADLS
jgi:prevent-host-death family protein